MPEYFLICVCFLQMLGWLVMVKEDHRACAFLHDPDEDDKQSSVLSELYEEHIKDELPVENDGREESMRIQDHKDGSISLKTEKENDTKLSIAEPKHLSASVLIKTDMDIDWKTVTVPETDRKMVDKPSVSSEFAEQLFQSCCHSHSLDNNKHFKQKANLDSPGDAQKGLKCSCEICGELFARKALLKQHMRNHIGQKHFLCDTCGHKFIYKSALDKHMRIHTGQKPFCCDLCGQRFSQKSTLKRHMSVHTGQKPFCCEVCGSTFTLESTLNTHMRIHTGQKPFCCDLCGHKFTWKVNEDQHQIQGFKLKLH
uniref:C2H2-type domain-containing protein n=1 Tax=Cyprinodon variegatus TaxID=28743 RepID=A0A3Q2E7U0_CYPVA